MYFRETYGPYPDARKDDTVDDYHGIRVADPYRWLEDARSPETTAWVAAQQALTRTVLDELPSRASIKARLAALWNHPRSSATYKKGGRYFFMRHDGLRNQAVLCWQRTLADAPTVLLDPNTLSADGTAALVNQAVSADGTLLAYGIARGGSDWEELRVRRIDDGQDYDEVLRWCRFTRIAWKHDQSGFFYSRYPEPGSVPESDQNHYNRVYWHQLGTPQEADRLIYERPDAKELAFDPSVTDDGRYLVLHVTCGTNPQNRIYYRAVDDTDGPFVRLLDDADAKYYFIDNIGTLFYFLTDLDAPRQRIIAIDLERPTREHWREIIPQQDDVLWCAVTANQRLVVVHLRDVHHEVKLYHLDGRLERDIPLPTVGSLTGVAVSRQDEEMLLTFQSFLYPPTTFHYDWATGALTPYRTTKVPFRPEDYTTRLVFYTSKDGTRVPMFLTHKQGLRLDGSNPVLLHGYGGFAASMTPLFSAERLAWLERGGVYAVAHIRGGGEYGETWHRAGMLEQKQNVFDDFIAAAEWLIESGYTRTQRLAIMGESNGGLLVAACMLQRPELFGAVICQVPVTDMLRYHRFTVGHFWIGEYGNAEENPEHFRFLRAYSPLHNIKPGTSYPPTLIITADTDDRVVPAHSFKFAAALQAADSGAHPLLLRVETQAGHGFGKPTAKLIEELSDIYAFLFDVFDRDAANARARATG